MFGFARIKQHGKVIMTKPLTSLDSESVEQTAKEVLDLINQGKIEQGYYELEVLNTKSEVIDSIIEIA